MRGWLVAVAVVVAFVGCGRLERSGEATGLGGADSEMAEGGAIVAGGAPGTSGAYSLMLPGGTAGGLALTTNLPQYSRACLEAQLSRVGSGGAEGLPIDRSRASDPAGGEGGVRVDLELGKGDLTLLVIFDKSGSMAEDWDKRTKWQVANEALLKATEGVVDNLTLGAIFFPQPGGCEVARLDSGSQFNFMTGRSFVSTWQETAGSRMPEGSTPLELAFRVADMAIERGCQLGLLDDRFRVVVVTDGEPTCSDDTTAILDLTAEWHRVGVETWVMGLPGSGSASALLDAIAAAGGTERAQSLGTPSALDRGLAEAAK